MLILHVPWLVAGEIRDVESDAEAERLVREMAGELGEAGGLAETRVTEPSFSAAPTIAKEAGQWDADLIVLGSRRLTALGGLLLGSTAHAVARRSSRPVLLAGYLPSQPEPPQASSD